MQSEYSRNNGQCQLDLDDPEAGDFEFGKFRGGQLYDFRRAKVGLEAGKIHAEWDRDVRLLQIQGRFTLFFDNHGREAPLLVND